MPENKGCPLLQPVRTNDKKKKKKTRKKNTDSATPSENTQKPQTVSLHPENIQVSSLLTPQSPGQPEDQLPRLRTAGKKSGERLAGSSSSSRRRRRRKKQPKDSQTRLTAATNKTSGCGAPARGCQSEPSTAQARESLRWEGALDDPQAEEQRLELYRANRRQRYMAHREAVLKETRDASRQTEPEQEENASPSLYLSTDLNLISK